MMILYRIPWLVAAMVVKDIFIHAKFTSIVSQRVWNYDCKSHFLYCQETAHITHFFLFCSRGKQFWNIFFTWWNNLGDIQIQTQCECLEENILFGFQTEGDIFTVLNFCILIAKYHIYCRRIYNENRIILVQYLIELKNKLRIERYICTSTATIEKFDKFQFLSEQL